MRFREGTLADGLSIIADLRQQQCRSLEKLQVSPEVLLRKVLGAGPSFTVLVDDLPAAMYGVYAESLLGLPKIWLITTPIIEREPIAFLRNSRRILAEFHAAYGSIIGMVDKDFEKSCVWLRWCGFVETRQGEFITMRYSGGH